MECRRETTASFRQTRSSAGISELLHQWDRANGLPQQALATAAREGRYEAEGWRAHEDGRLFWASVIIDRICDDAGRPVGFAKVTRDITERR
jgi:PAS domain S-box-containing protein